MAKTNGINYVGVFKRSLTPTALNERITIKNYGCIEETTRRDALNFYYDCMKNSEGAEHERYETIFFQLLEGNTTCSDEIAFYEF